jgi:hypothetical protein
MEVSGQLHDPAVLPTRKESPVTWVGPRAVLYRVVKRKIPSSREKRKYLRKCFFYYVVFGHVIERMWYSGIQMWRQF